MITGDIHSPLTSKCNPLQIRRQCSSQIRCYISDITDQMSYIRMYKSDVTDQIVQIRCYRSDLTDQIVQIRCYGSDCADQIVQIRCYGSDCTDQMLQIRCYRLIMELYCTLTMEHYPEGRGLILEK